MTYSKVYPPNTQLTRSLECWAERKLLILGEAEVMRTQVVHCQVVQGQIVSNKTLSCNTS